MRVNKTGVFSLMLASSLTIMVGTVIVPSLPEIASHLGFLLQPGWLITLPALGVVLMAPLAGYLNDRYGAYLVMLAGLIPYAAFGFSAQQTGYFMAFISIIAVLRPVRCPRLYTGLNI